MYCERCGFNMREAAYCASCGAPAPPTDTATPYAQPGPATFGAPAYGSPYAPAPHAGEIATFWPRFGAYLLDYVFSSIIGGIGAVVLAIAFGAVAAAGQETAITPAQQSANDDAVAAAATAGAYLGYLPLYYGYHWIATAMGGGWGKRIAGLRVVRDSDGEAPGYGTALLRVFISLFSGAVFSLGYLWSIWDAKRKTWHDHAAATTVIRVR